MNSYTNSDDANISKFNIALKIRAQNGPLARFVQESGLSQKALADKINISYMSFNNFVNMRNFPRNREQMDILCKMTGESAEQLFPSFLRNPEFLRLNKKTTIFKDVDIVYLTHERIQQIAYAHELQPDEMLAKKELNSEVNDALNILTEREREIIIDTILRDQTVEKTAQKFNVTRSRVNHIKSRAERKMKKYIQIQKRGTKVSNMLIHIDEQKSRKQYMREYQKVRRARKKKANDNTEARIALVVPPTELK